MSVQNEAKIWAFIAQSGQGKGLLMKAALRKLKPKRIIILDTKDENGEFADMVSSLSDLAMTTFKKEFKVRYQLKATTNKGRRDEFEILCRIASAAGNCVFLIEELGRYTMASYAPPAWADCCNDGRHDGLHIIAASQFPAQIDKAFLGNCTEIWCGYLGEENHRVVMAKKMDVPAQQIKELAQFQFLYFHRDSRTVKKVVAKIPR
jgi:hypothetical protein